MKQKRPQNRSIGERLGIVCQISPVDSPSSNASSAQPSSDLAHPTGSCSTRKGCREKNMMFPYKQWKTVGWNRCHAVCIYEKTGQVVLSEKHSCLTSGQREPVFSGMQRKLDARLALFLSAILLCNLSDSA